MRILRSLEELKSARPQIAGTFGLVPTMGALHEGHLALVREMRKHTENVIVSIFVNPTQFGPNEDFNKYPRNIEADLKKLEALADYAYLPQLTDIYPDGEKITVKAGAAAQGLESDFRPGHFDGVATVVSTLFNQIKPDHAIFGEKDYQQLMVIKEMVNQPSTINHQPIILSLPTVREPDGLAMSSRNAYLSPEERKLSPLLYSSLRGTAEAIQKTGSLHSVRDDIIKNLKASGFKIQYLEQRWNRLLVAAYLGNTRLIDNIPVSD